MNLIAQTARLSEITADWLIIGAWENEGLAGAGDLDAPLDGILAQVRERGDITGKAKELVPIHAGTPNVPRLLVVGLGPRDKADCASLLAAASTASRSLTTRPLHRIAFSVPVDV